MTTPLRPRTWEDCDGRTTCHCHEPFLCADCGCTHNEAEAAPDLRAAVKEFLRRWDDPERYHRLPAVNDLRAALDPEPVAYLHEPSREPGEEG